MLNQFSCRDQIDSDATLTSRVFRLVIGGRVRPEVDCVLGASSGFFRNEQVH